MTAGLPMPLAMPLLGCGPAALELLRKLAVAVIGCGSVGGRIAVLLARLGFGGLLLVDPKSYKPASLATHEIGPEEVGQPKALAVARRCKGISPSTQVRAFAGPVQDLELAELAGVDLIVMAPDLLSVELHVGQCSLWLEKPLFQASVHGPTLTLHIRSFLNEKAAGGCPLCCYGRAEFDLLSRQTRFSCEGTAHHGLPSPVDAPSTNSLSPLCSMAADMAALQILRFLLKLGQPVSDTILEYCLFNHRTVISPVVRNASCKLDHTVFDQATVAAPLADLSLADLTLRATGEAAPPDEQFEVAEHDWIELAACGCEQLKPVRQFVRRGHLELALCRQCAAPLVPLSFYTHRAVSASVLGSAAEQPLRKLGARRISSILLRTAGRGVLIRSEPSIPRQP